MLHMEVDKEEVGDALLSGSLTRCVSCVCFVSVLACLLWFVLCIFLDSCVKQSHGAVSIDLSGCISLVVAAFM
jgi:hypothetical protein